jgi:hypothetical protein
MSLLFGDRFRLVKHALALFLFVGLCTWTNARLGPIHPPMGGVPIYGDIWRDKIIAPQGYLVVAHTPDGFDLESKGGTIRILTAERPPVGEHVSLVGRIAGNGRIEALRIQVNEGWRWKRPLNYGVSVLVLLVFLWLIRDRFRIRLAEGLFRSRC